MKISIILTFSLFQHPALFSFLI